MPKRKLIEVALPLEAINRESAREKSIRHGHPSTLHLWWARRPLAACRAVLFASLVDDPSSHPDRFPTEADQEVERQRLFTLIEKLVPWEATADPRSSKRHARRSRRRAPTARRRARPLLGRRLDPSRSTASRPRRPRERPQSGCRLITKALVELPPRVRRPPAGPPGRGAASEAGWTGARGLAEDVRLYGAWMRDEAAERIGHLYPDAMFTDGTTAPVIAWLWARTVRCPNPACGATMPLVSTYTLATKPGKRRWLAPEVDRGAKTVHFCVSATTANVRHDQGRSGIAVPLPRMRRGDRGGLCAIRGPGGPDRQAGSRAGRRRRRRPHLSRRDRCGRATRRHRHTRRSARRLHQRTGARGPSHRLRPHRMVRPLHFAPTHRAYHVRRPRL